MAKDAFLTVFYDGGCRVCSTEMRHYRSVADERVRFVDIAAVDFDPDKYGLSLEAFQKELHVRDAEGRFFTGVEAFRRLWEALPSPFYSLLSGLIGLPVINQAARAGYKVFARYRHLLPKRQTHSCPLPRREEK